MLKVLRGIGSLRIGKEDKCVEESCLQASKDAVMEENGAKRGGKPISVRRRELTSPLCR